VSARWLGLLARRKITLIGAVLMAVMLVLGTLGPLVAGNPTRMDVASRLSPPSALHWFGTDDVGRDVFSRVIHGARLSLEIGFLASVIALSIGAVYLINNYLSSIDQAEVRYLGALWNWAEG